MSQIEPVGYMALLRENRRFRLLWFGQIISLLGDWFDLIASASLIAALTQSGTAVGSLFVVRMLAPFVVSPFAGVAADRYNRKHLLILSDIARGIIVLGFLLVRRAEDVWLLYALTALQLGLSGVFFPTRNAILPDITSKHELGAANAISSTTWSVMLAFGAAIGGLVSGLWGNYPAFIIDAATFFLSALFIGRIVYRRPPELAASEKTIAAALRQYADGLRYLRHHVDILLIALHKGAISLLVTGVFQVVQVALSEKVFVIGEGGGFGLGLMYAFTGIGTGLGPILARRFTGDHNQALRKAIFVSYVIGAIGLLITATLISFPVVLIGTFVRGFGSAIAWVFSTQLLLQLVPDRMRGRVFSTEFAMFTLMNAIGAGIGGVLLDAGATDAALLQWTGLLSLLPGVLWALWLWSGKYERARADDSSAAGS